MTRTLRARRLVLAALGLALAGCAFQLPRPGAPAGAAAPAPAPPPPAPPSPPPPSPPEQSKPRPLEDDRELKAVLYRNARVLLELERDEESYRTLVQLVKLDPRYRDAASVLAQARERLIRRHYNEGLRLYREEKLEDAIAEWRVVLRYAPKHADARKGIEQAERLLRRLDTDHR